MLPLLCVAQALLPVPDGNPHECRHRVENPQRLAEVPGLGVDSAQQILAEVGASAATFASPKQLCSWVGATLPNYSLNHAR